MWPRCRSDSGTGRPRSAAASAVCCRVSRRIRGTFARRRIACRHTEIGFEACRAVADVQAATPGLGNVADDGETEAGAAARPVELATTCQCLVQALRWDPWAIV